MSFTASNMGNLPNGNLTGNTLTTEQYRADAAGLLLQNVDSMDGSAGKGLAIKRIQSGVDASKPAGGNAGTVYVATDTGLLYYDDGSDLEVCGALDTNNAWTGNNDFSGAAATTGLKVPSAAGAAPTAAAAVAYDSTANRPVYGDGSHTVPVGPTMLSFTSSGFGAGTGIAQGATRYIMSGGDTSVSADGHPLPLPVTLTRLYVLADTAAGAGQSFAFTVYKNGSATTITCTISGASAKTANDTAHAVAFAAGDTVSVQVVSSAGAANGISMLCMLGN